MGILARHDSLLKTLSAFDQLCNLVFEELLFLAGIELDVNDLLLELIDLNSE